MKGPHARRFLTCAMASFKDIPAFARNHAMARVGARLRPALQCKYTRFRVLSSSCRHWRASPNLAAISSELPSRIGVRTSLIW